MVKITRLSKRAVVRMWHACPASWSHSMIVRRLCVTPAVGSLMQWLLTRRNLTTTQSTNGATVSQRRNTEYNKEYRRDVSGKPSNHATGTNTAAAARAAEARQEGGARGSASSARVGRGDPGCSSPEHDVRVWRLVRVRLELR